VYVYHSLCVLSLYMYSVSHCVCLIGKHRIYLSDCTQWNNMLLTDVADFRQFVLQCTFCIPFTKVHFRQHEHTASKVIYLPTAQFVNTENTLVTTSDICQWTLATNTKKSISKSVRVSRVTYNSPRRLSIWICGCRSIRSASIWSTITTTWFMET